MVYYSTVFPKFQTQRTAFERRDAALGGSFTRRYEIWLAVHALLKYQDEQLAASRHATTDAAEDAEQTSSDLESAEAREREERIRVAFMSAMFAAREVQIEAPALTEQMAAID